MNREGGIPLKIRMLSSALLVCLTATVLSGCAQPQPGTTTPPVTTPSTTAVQTTIPATMPPATTLPVTTPVTVPVTNGGQTVKHQILPMIPESLKSTVEALKKGRGYFYFQNEKILVIFMGERSTGGYSISLSQISAQGSALSVIVAEKSPKPGDIVTQAFTYPMLILQLEDTYDSFHITNTNGEVFEKSVNTMY